jgi:hypothetical protein
MALARSLLAVAWAGAADAHMGAPEQAVTLLVSLGLTALVLLWGSRARPDRPFECDTAEDAAARWLH